MTSIRTKRRREYGKTLAKRYSQLKQNRAKFSTWMELGIVWPPTWMELGIVWPPTWIELA